MVLLQHAWGTYHSQMKHGYCSVHLVVLLKLFFFIFQAYNYNNLHLHRALKTFLSALIYVIFFLINPNVGGHLFSHFINEKIKAHASN